MANTSKLGLPLLANGAANQTLANTTFALINQLLMAGVVDKDLSTPPSSPANESLYIVASGNWGTASSKAGQLAFWLADVGAWTFIVPRAGWEVRVLDELDSAGLPLVYAYTGSAWVQQPSSGGGGGGAVSSVNGQTGAVLLPAENLLINGDFSLNQRLFAGGSLAPGVYGYDRWGAYNGGATFSFSGGVANLSGTICQPIEAPGLAGVNVAVSLWDVTGTITVTLGSGTGSSSVSGVVPAGSGQKSIVLSVPSSLTGDVKLRITGSGVSFSKAKVEIGGATPWRPRFAGEEYRLACRYYHRITGDRSTDMIFSTGGASGNSLVVKVPLPSYMRAIPAVTTNITNANYAASAPTASTWVLAASNIGYATKSGTATVSAEGGRAAFSLYVTGATFSPVPNQAGLGANLYMISEAEMTCID